MDYINSQPTPKSVPLERIDSGETDDSPFSSKLATPTDGQTIPVIVRSQLHDGIDEKIIVAKDYLATDSIEDDFQADEDSIKADKTIFEAQAELELSKPPLVEELEGVSLSQTRTSEFLIPEDGDISNLSTLDSNQTIPSSHPSLAEVVAQARRSSSALYNLPNSHISIDDRSSGSGSEAEGDNTILQEHFPLPPEEVSKQSTQDLLFAVSWPEDLRAVVSNLTIHSLYSLACQILLFFPWCIAIGAAIVLSPTNLSAIAFTPSLNYIPHPSTPIELFAYWANYGLHHVTIFAGFVFIILWNFPNGGIFLLGALLAQFCWVWHDFLPERTTALGEDERQMVYHLARSTWLTGNTVGIKKSNGKYYATEITDIDHDHKHIAVDSDSGSESDWFVT